MDEGERLISANTFSKSWLMTGWRLGWLVVPPSLMADLGKLIEYNTSCAPVFVQRAGIAALAARASRWSPIRSSDSGRRGTFLSPSCAKIPACASRNPTGAMYAFFSIEGVTDSLAFCKRLVREQGLGLAPGSAFGPQGEGFVRWCFAASHERLAEGVRRLRRALETR